jgi:hypothetical protein
MSSQHFFRFESMVVQFCRKKKELFDERRSIRESDAVRYKLSSPTAVDSQDGPIDK